MFIYLKHIQEVFEQYETFLIGTADMSYLLDWKPVTEAVNGSLCSRHTLYLAKSLADLGDLEVREELHLLLLTEDISVDRTKVETRCRPAHVLLLQRSDTEQVEEKLQEFFSRQIELNMFAREMLDILFYEGGVQKMIDTVYQYFGNPVLLFDTGFHLIAANWEEMQKHENFRDILEAKAFMDLEYELINHHGHIHNKMKQSRTPVFVHHPEFGYDQLLCNINYEKDIGHLVLCAVNKPILEGDWKMMELLREAINQQLKKDEFVRNSKGFHYEYFLRDLLDQKIVASTGENGHLDYVDAEFDGRMYALVVESRRSSRTLNIEHIRSEFERAYPRSKSMIYNGEIVILMRKVDDGVFTDQDYKTLAGICKKHRIYAGCSNGFDNIMQLYHYYKQALRAIELGTGEQTAPDLFVYQNYYLQHLSSIFFQKEELSVFCHPDMKILLDYDQSHGSQLAETLYQFLICERSSQLAAQRLDVHRNTMNNRLKKIEQLTDLNLDQIEEREYLQLSYQFYKNCRK